MDTKREKSQLLLGIEMIELHPGEMVLLKGGTDNIGRDANYGCNTDNCGCDAECNCLNSCDPGIMVPWCQ